MPSQVRVLPPPPAFARFASYSSASQLAAPKPVKRVCARRSLSSGRPELVIGPRSARTRWAGPVGRAMGRRRASPTSRLYPESGCDLHHSTLSRGGSDCREVPWGPQNPSRRRFLRGSLSTTGQRPLLFTPLDMDRPSCCEPKYRRFLPAFRGRPTFLPGRPQQFSPAASLASLLQQRKDCRAQARCCRQSLLCDIRKFCDSDHSTNGKSCDRDHSTNLGVK